MPNDTAAPKPAKPARQSGTSAQRIRIGLTGLAIAFLVVLLASAVNRASGTEESNAAKNAATQAAVKDPSEPLAEIGVAPGGSDSVNGSANAAANSAADRPANK